MRAGRAPDPPPGLEGRPSPGRCHSVPSPQPPCRGRSCWRRLSPAKHSVCLPRAPRRPPLRPPSAKDQFWPSHGGGGHAEKGRSADGGLAPGAAARGLALLPEALRPRRPQPVQASQRPEPCRTRPVGSSSTKRAAQRRGPQGAGGLLGSASHAPPGSRPAPGHAGRGPRPVDPAPPTPDRPGSGSARLRIGPDSDRPGSGSARFRIGPVAAADASGNLRTRGPSGSCRSGPPSPHTTATFGRPRASPAADPAGPCPAPPATRPAQSDPPRRRWVARTGAGAAGPSPKRAGRPRPPRCVDLTARPAGAADWAAGARRGWSCRVG